MEMCHNRTATIRLPAVIALIGPICAFTSGTKAQEVLPYGPPASTGSAGVRSPEEASLRSELDELSGLLRAQQRQIELQARQLGQMQRVLASEQAQDPSTPFRSIPTQYSATGATPSSFSAANVSSSPKPHCGDCQPYDDCQACGSCAGCVSGVGAADPWIDVGGQYRIMYNASNFGFHPATLNNAQQSQTFFNQRFRTWLEIRPNDNVEGYLQVEMGHIGWGSNLDFPKTYVGPRFPGSVDPNGDRVGVELRYGYVGYQNAGLGRMRVGIQPWQDAFDQTLFSSDWDFSVGGYSWVRTLRALGGADMQLGVFALDEGQVQRADDAVLLTLDLDWVRSDDRSWGFSAYYLPDSGVYSYPTAAAYDSAWDAWFGLRGTTVLWSLPVHAFALYNTGERHELGALPTFRHDDAALKLEIGPLPIGCGALSFQTLYSTGDDNLDENLRDGFRTVAQSVPDNFGSQGYWSYLVLTSPHGPSDVNDLGVGLQNRGLGLFTVQGKYDYPIFGALSGTIAAGWLRSDARNPTSGATDMGTELANMFTLDLSGGLKIDLGASVLFTGEFYRAAPAGPRPDDLWEVFTRAQLEF